MSETIAVIGAGQMGNGIAHVFAQGGYRVTLIDIAQDRLDSLAAAGKAARPAPIMVKGARRTR